MTVVITLALLVPTVVYLHLRLPKLRRVVEAICLLPIVIPPVVLIVGVLQVAPVRLKATPYLLALEYVVLALPFAYRSLDAGLAAIDLRTLVDAARSLGSGWVSTLMRVVLPNMRSAVMSATVLTAALVLGEFTLASLDQYQTFPVWVVAFDQDDARVSVAVSLLALVLTWAFLLLLSALDVRRARRVRTPGDTGDTADDCMTANPHARHPLFEVDEPAEISVTPSQAGRRRRSSCAICTGASGQRSHSTGCR